MAENSISAVSNKKQEQLNDILSIIKAYEIEVEECGSNSYDCTWTSNGLKFQIRIVEDLKKLRNEDIKFELSMIYVLLHLGDDDWVLDQINSFDPDKGILVIYDEKEDVQMFSKDIWNLLLSLKRNRDKELNSL